MKKLKIQSENQSNQEENLKRKTFRTLLFMNVKNVA
jgi:hypothetical protein